MSAMALHGLENSSREGEEEQDKFNVQHTVNDYCSASSEIFRGLTEVKRRGWAKEEGDNHFKQQQQQADKAVDRKKTREGFYVMMQRIGAEMQVETGALSLPNDEPRILDLCMAPGGYAYSALEENPTATVLGITLPVGLGGHPVLLKRSPRVRVKYTDITMEAAELGVTDVPREDPDYGNFKVERLLPAESKFNLIFCDCQVLRNHAKHRHPDGEVYEATRLLSSQLIIAMQHIRPGGTMIVLLHRVEAWQNIQLLQTFDKFADVRLFKPTEAHASRNSFYMIAQNIELNHAEAIAATQIWLQRWKSATFHRQHLSWPAEEEFSSLLETFGKRLIELAEPVWAAQRQGIEGSKWYQKI